MQTFAHKGPTPLRGYYPRTSPRVKPYTRRHAVQKRAWSQREIAHGLRRGPRIHAQGQENYEKILLFRRIVQAGAFSSALFLHVTGCSHVFFLRCTRGPPGRPQTLPKKHASRFGRCTNATRPASARRGTSPAPSSGTHPAQTAAAKPRRKRRYGA